MSNLETPTSILPSITGNQAIDRLIRSALIAIAAGATGVIVTWLNAHGFRDPNLSLMISGAIVSILSAIAVTVWGYINGKHSETAAKCAVVAGVQAGIAHAEDTSVPTTPITAVSPEVAKAIVAEYSPLKL